VILNASKYVLISYFRTVTVEERKSNNGHGFHGNNLQSQVFLKRFICSEFEGGDVKRL
jgi:hypothetical protein